MCIRDRSERPVSSLARVGAQLTAQAPGPVRALPTAKLVARSCQLSYQPFLKIVCEAVTCGNGAPGGIRTPNLLIQSQMLPESYHLFEAYRGQGDGRDIGPQGAGLRDDVHGPG